MNYINRASRYVSLGKRCWRCKWMFQCPAEQPARITCRACESKP